MYQATGNASTGGQPNANAGGQTGSTSGGNNVSDVEYEEVNDGKK
jgi:hypothetical protein